jgi:hypothetical protein
MKNTLLEKSILSTVCYFDVSDYPLTLMEIFKWLKISNNDHVSLADIKMALDDSKYLNKRLEFKDGYYFLFGRGDLVAIRMQRYGLAEHKFKRAIGIIKILSYFPYIRMIGICNTLAYSNARQESDIDLFFIVKKGRIWQTRLIVTGLLHVFHLRPSKDNTEDKICSTFFISDDSLNIKNIAISENDYYFIYWLTQVFPVYEDGIYNLFLKSNDWIRDQLPNYLSVLPSYYRRVKTADGIKKYLKMFFCLVPEVLAKKIQLKIMPSDLRQMANLDTRVVVNNKMLKFHKTDRRMYYNTKFEKNLKQLL